MDDELTVRRWVMPSVVMLVIGSVMLIYFLVWGPNLFLLVPGAFATLAGIVALTEFWNYQRWQILAREDERARIHTQTADSTLAEKMRELASQSPELAAEMARRIGRPDMILLPAMKGRQPQIVIAGTDVRLHFALHVLSRSSDQYMVAQRNYEDGTYHFDHNREISDRGQWVQLNHFLSQQAMVTRYVPGLATNLSPQWLPPWTPAKIIRDWLIANLLEQFRPYLEVDNEK